MSFCYLQRWLAVEAVKSGDLASERLKPIDAPPGYTFKTSGSSGLRDLVAIDIEHDKLCMGRTVGCDG